jgi:MarR family transcriptional regulator, organic hydroperoxide resistance regulator
MKVADSKYGQCLYFSSNALARRTEKLAQESWSKVDLSPSHAYLLMLVIEEPGIQPGQLAMQLHLQPSTITRLVEKLESKKLLVRTTEGKITNVYPSPKGKALLPKMNECVREFHASCNALLGKEELAKLVNQMGKLSDKFID